VGSNPTQGPKDCRAIKREREILAPMIILKYDAQRIGTTDPVGHD
jgi:hypothetical protein